jgi:hypothetical protein
MEELGMALELRKEFLYLSDEAGNRERGQGAATYKRV